MTVLAAIAVRNKKRASFKRKSADDFFSEIIVTPHGRVKSTAREFEDRRIREQLFFRRKRDLLKYSGSFDYDLKVLRQEEISPESTPAVLIRTAKHVQQQQEQPVKSIS